jgi:hypothetical protein
MVRRAEEDPSARARIIFAKEETYEQMSVSGRVDFNIADAEEAPPAGAGIGERGSRAFSKNGAGVGADQGKAEDCELCAKEMEGERSGRSRRAMDLYNNVGTPAGWLKQ